MLDALDFLMLLALDFLTKGSGVEYSKVLGLLSLIALSAPIGFKLLDLLLLPSLEFLVDGGAGVLVPNGCNFVTLAFLTLVAVVLVLLTAGVSLPLSISFKLAALDFRLILEVLLFCIGIGAPILDDFLINAGGKN